METDNIPYFRRLFNVPVEALNKESPSETYVEQYKVYLDFLDKLADRRQSANSFFLTINSGFCAAIAFLCSKDAADNLQHLQFLIPFAGILLSVFWHRLVASFRQLSSAKFDVIHKIEESLPIAPYTAEWIILGCGKDSSKYTPLTNIEIWIPRLFIAMYIVLLAQLAPWSKIVEMVLLR